MKNSEILVLMFLVFALIVPTLGLLSSINILDTHIVRGNIIFDRPNIALEPLDKDLYFEDNVIEGLKLAWDESGNNEYLYCIDGRFSSGYQTNSSSKSNFTELSGYILGHEHYVSAGNCLTFAKIHKHPTAGCQNRMWKGDTSDAINFFMKGGSYYLIHCARDRIEVYDRDNTYSSYTIKI